MAVSPPGRPDNRGPWRVRRPAVSQPGGSFLPPTRQYIASLARRLVGFPEDRGRRQKRHYHDFRDILAGKDIERVRAWRTAHPRTGRKTTLGRLVTEAMN